MTRRILPAAETVSNWTSIAGAIAGILRFFGRDFSESEVMGISGHAFRLAISAGPAGLPAVESPFDIDYECALELYRNLGLEWEHVGIAAVDPGAASQRSQALKRIKQSIDRGRPVAAYGLHLGEFGVIKGYDDRENVLFVSTAVSGQYGERLPLSQWPAPGRPVRIDLLIPGPARQVDQRAAESQSIAFALDYAHNGEPAAPAQSTHGLAAYERWLDALDADSMLDASGNARSIQVLQSARRDAALYLRAIASRHNSRLHNRFESAASEYQLEALAISRMATLFPYPSGGDASSGGALRLAAASLRQGLEHERRAIAALEAIEGELIGK
jgi:hypothetical protein